MSLGEQVHYHVKEHFESLATSRLHQILVGIPLSLIGIYLLQLAIIQYQNYQARKHGCAPTKAVYLGYPLGLANVITRARDMANDVFLINVQQSAEEQEKKGLYASRRVVMGSTWVMTNHPENIKTILATNFRDYSLGYRWNVLLPFLGNGIFTLSGEGWKHSRNMLRPQFNRDQVTHLQSMKEHVSLLLRRFIDDSFGGRRIDAQNLYHELTLDTATEFLFGSSSNVLSPHSTGVVGPLGPVTGAEFATAFDNSQLLSAMRLFMGPLYFLLNPSSLRKSNAVCHNFIDYYVLKALENPLEKDQVSERYVFIDELTKETRDPKVIRDQAINILLAGRDTTAGLLSYATFYLGKHKDVFAKLRQVVLTEFGTTDEGMTFESLKRCKYLQSVINEVLRLHPNVPTNFRTAVRDTKLPIGGGPKSDQPVFVPKGTNVFYSAYCLQRSPKYWGEDSNEFRPERWEDHNSQHTWDFVPFNGGPRICLGQQFALTEASLTLARLAQEVQDITVYHPDPVTVNPRNMKQRARFTTNVSGGVIASFTAAEK